MNPQDILNRRIEQGFTPSDEQKKAKSAFWTYVQESGVSTPPDYSPQMAAKFVNPTWIKQAGFTEWFWNQSEFSERLEYLAQLALDELETTLKSKLITASQKIPAIKLALEVASKLNQRQAATDGLPERIASMSRQELESLIKSRASGLEDESDTSDLTSDAESGNVN